MRPVRSTFACAALMLATACTSDGPLGSGAPGPVVLESAVSANPHNVLSAAVRARTGGTDSIRVRFVASDGELDGFTPSLPVAADSAVVPVLGLLPDTHYTLQVVAFGQGGTAAGEPLEFTTGSLPEDLPAFVARGTAPSPGFVVLGVGRYGVVIDNQGRVVWYRHFPDGLGLNFQAQPNGRYVALPPSPRPAWVELDVFGAVTRTLHCARGLQPRFHDLLVTPESSYWLLCDETRTMDLSGAGGAREARVTGTVIQHVAADGVLLFEWSVFDHFKVTDVDARQLASADINWTHGNALDLDAQGDLLVSFRNLSEITKIDVPTGAVLWRMGGVRNQFAFESSPGPPFARQHSVRETAPGTLLLLDNLGDPSSSRALRYSYDAAARTARLVESRESLPPVVAHLGGTAQHLPAGHILVSFGNAALVAEYDAGGSEVWRLEEPGYVFRAQRIHSLYSPGVGSAR